MLKPGDPAFDELVADLKNITSSRYAEQFLWSVDDTTVLAKGDSGARFERLHATEQTEVLKWSIEWSHYENQGLSQVQADAIFRNVHDGKPPERWLEGVFDEAFKALVEDMKNNRAPKEMDGIGQIWAGLSPAAKLQTIAREAARHHVPFEPFAEMVKNTLGDMGEAALRVVLDSQKELHAIAKLFPDHGWTEPAPLIEQVKEMLDRVSALETQEKERHQGREKLFEGISDVLDGKPPQAWSDAAKAFRDILRGVCPGRNRRRRKSAVAGRCESDVGHHETTGSDWRGGRIMLTVKQVAERLRISASLVYSWCEDHLLPHYRMGGKGKRGKILIEEASLDAFLQSCKVERKAVDTSSLGLKHIALR